MGILQSPPSVRPSVRLSVRPSVRPSRYLLLNHWTKFNQIWCVGCSHEWGVQRHIFFWPRPLGPWGGAKRSNIIKCHYPHAFLKKRWGYCNRLRPSVRPSVRPSRYLLLNHWTKFNQIWCVGCSHEWGVQRHIFFWPRPLGPWGGAKRSNIIKCH